MSAMVQVRNVPESIHRQLKARAALAGMSLSEYLLGELRKTLDRPTREELLQRLSRRVPVTPPTAPAAAVRRERNGR